MTNFNELTGRAEHDDFERGAEDMERRARRLEAEREADQEAAMQQAENFKNPADGLFCVRCRVSGGVTGTRESLLKANGEVIYFPTHEAALARANALMVSMNHAYSVADFNYWVVPATEVR